MEVMYMNKLIKSVISFGIMMTMMLTMYNTNIYAAEVTTKEETVTVMETQGCNSNISEYFEWEYVDELGDVSTISFNAHCTYGVQWDEGYSGWVTDAVFSVSNTKVNGSDRTFTKCYGVSQQNGSNKYMDYSITSQYRIRVSLSCDEWGDVSLSAYRV